ncbi:MAG: 3-oxoacyl-ACP reductase family protein [Thermodesulfobacteriota bacterium]|nr:3-oxoacyl-ACP reductase family protein [Thermodesulfobacteriota bacterium]
MDLGLKGKAVIVTGAASNIGRAIALEFAKEGSRIAIADLDEKGGQKVVDLAKELGAEGAIFIKTDVTKSEQCNEMAREVLDKFDIIDVLVNNAGWGKDALFIEKPREEWEKEIDINLWGVINCIKAVVDHLVEKKGGSIVSIASDAGRMGEFREAVYAAAKAGVIGLTKSLARELGPYGIRMNVVCPGATLPTSPDEIGEKSMWGDSMPAITPEFVQKIAKRYPLRRIARPDELAKAVVFLASEGAGFITGQTLSVSGGYTMV